MRIPHSTPPHGSEAVLLSGNIHNPKKALILIHGRGASAEDIMGIVPHLDLPDDVLVLAPQAAQHTWYPERFIAPQAANQPFLNATLDRVDTLISFLGSQFQITPQHIALAGFSQGACVVAEYIKRHPQRYFAAAIWSGGLIGDEREIVSDIPGSLAGTPVYLGCDEEDLHIPKERVEVTAEYLKKHDATVTTEFYKNFGHSIHQNGISFLKENMNPNK